MHNFVRYPSTIIEISHEIVFPGEQLLSKEIGTDIQCMYRAELSVAMGPSVCARKSLSLIHRQKLASGSNYDRACVRAHAASWHVRQSGERPASTCTPPKWGPRRRRARSRLYDYSLTGAHSFLSSFIQILMNFIYWMKLNDEKII